MNKINLNFKNIHLPEDHKVLGKHIGVICKYCSISFFPITHFKEIFDIFITSNSVPLLADISSSSLRSTFLQLDDFFNIDNDLLGKCKMTFDVLIKMINDFNLLNK